MRLIYTIVRLVWHVLVGVVHCALPIFNRASRQAYIRRWSITLLHICGTRVVIRHHDGSAPQFSSALMVANHVSWLDIFVINALQPCRFVAKSDIRDWPLLGWLCAKTGTIFISRGKPRQVRQIFQNLVRSIAAGDRIAFFPEGTTAAQGSLLPFHANLFEAAIDAGVPVQPYALRYLDANGDLHSAVNFIGATTMIESMRTILRARDITAELTLLAPIASAGLHRRDLALATRAAIAQALHNATLSPDAALVDNRPESACGLQGIAR